MNVLRRTVSALLTTAVLAVAPALAPAKAEVAISTPIAPRVNYGSGYWGGVVGGPVETGNIQTADVALYGDSIASRCGAYLRTALAAKGKTLYTYTWSGQNTKGLFDAALSALRQPPTVIMAAGTNDVFQPPLVGPQIAKAKSYAAEAGTHLMWVDTYVGRSTYLAADVRNSGWVNGQIYSQIGQGDVIGWNAALGYAVGRGRALSYYLQDGVHPWATAGTGHGNGCSFWAGVIAAGVR